MRLIGLAVVLAVSLTLASLVAEAQQTGKVYRIGWLAPASLPTTLDAFRDGLRVFGYVEGNNLVIEQRYANGKPERLAGLVAELVGAKADVIVTTGNQATAAAKSTTGSIPVVFVAGDPVEAGFVASLARPGGNMTGVNTLPGINAKRLELLREAFPKVSRVAVLFEPRQLSTTIPQIEAAASSLGLQVMRLEVHGAYDFERALAAAVRSHVGALSGSAS
jgi:ABC-type uncharacterized transport system substrate-binding protein